MARHDNLPVMVGHNLGKGLMVVENPKMGGYDLIILWLNKDVPWGEPYELDDIKKTDVVLHFCDLQSVKAMQIALKQMEVFFESDKSTVEGIIAEVEHGNNNND